MLTLIVSDLHLYQPVDNAKLKFLKKIISEADRVILNGDFFDAYMTDFDSFIKSSWNELFPILKSKRAVYLYGNHDKQDYSDKNSSLFSTVQTHRYKLKSGNRIFIFEHGHKIRVTPDTVLKLEGKMLSFVIAIAHLFRNFMTRLLGKTFLRARFAYRNKIAKKKINEVYRPKHNEVYVIGHNHWGEIDLENHFAASGAILYGYYQYLTIEDSTIKLHEGWYR